ncbi:MULTISPECIES: selenide, water dikinase SelD [unclassified Cyanobium]|uniref:selenide, water dikinase SelD n=1 Tax=unclassified Cyanobium TaxID=2627006 RepID=UPI0020CE7B2D|nr:MULTISPECIES: selenide, water dikinase SelD [unclassified Cyanobium]MCP9835332.1 selenide, water dikinase SelD [Cyanobium sp. La Preciosa 7G6]MCP9938150.1 selenide, water dikinase SelD [Cyanobium sp. Aljojuca 7A6]
MTIAPERHQLVLAGGGHSHVLVLRRWLMRPRHRPLRTRLTLVSRHGTALYSGLLPAVVAGLEPLEAAAIDLRRLCSLAGVAFVQAEITGLDPAARELHLAGRPPLRFDRLSLDLGAVTATPGAAMAVKPLEPFLAWAERRAAGEPLVIRGGGAAAVELALAFRARGLACRLLLQGEVLHLGSAAANRAGERLLAQAAIPIQRRAPPGAPADLACTGSRAPAWLAAAGLPVDPASGRVLTHPSLQVIGHPELFAAGDCGLIATDPRPPSGVWAVRAAPVLAYNLGRSLGEPPTPLRPWRPQARALQLLGDGGWQAAGPRALALFGPLVLGPSGWIWRWKQRIDRAFMARFATLQPMAAAAMACRGCAAKLGAAPLSAALARLDPGGQSAPVEDAARVGTGVDGALLLQSVDGFPALVDDPWLNGRLTTLHACSDLWASGATVASVQALVTVPEAAAAIQEELLLQTLAGVHSVLEPLGAALIGGHTLEGRDGAGLALALTVNGWVAPAASWGKGPLRPGDALLLSRPLGTGVLFAAAMAGAGAPEWMEAVLVAMQRSQAALVPLLVAHGCGACTDVTGFGLLGHLGEMLDASGAELAVELAAAAIPAYGGALELLERGFASSLAPANAAALALLEGPVRLVGAEGGGLAELLIDPQTCGPLLAALPAQRAPAALAALHQGGFPEACLIGRVSGREAAAASPGPG